MTWLRERARSAARDPAALHRWVVWVILGLNTAIQLTTLQMGLASGNTSLGRGTYNPAIPVILFLVAAAQWPPQSRRRAFLGTSLLIFIAATTAGMLGVFDRKEAVYSALSVLAHCYLMLAFMQLFKVDLRRSPDRLSSFAGILSGATIGTITAAGFGFFPFFWTGDNLLDLLWWELHNASGAAISVALGLVLMHGNIAAELRKVDWLEFAAMAVVGGGALTLVMRPESMLLGWLILVPAVWAGMRLSTVQAAALCAVLGVAVAAAAISPFIERTSAELPLPHWALFDGTLTSFVFVVLTMAVMRDQREHLIEQVLAERAEVAEHAAMNRLVLHSMSDGVLLLNHSGTVEFFNERAAQLLGRRALESGLDAWSELTGDARVELLRGKPQTVLLHGHDEVDGERPLLQARFSLVRFRGKDKVFVFIRDITNEQAKLDSLTRFAEVAAHDLKSPLTALVGWVHLARTSLADDPEGAVHALNSTERVALRMADQIDGWLAYNVAREGTLSTEPLSLERLTTEVATTFPKAVVEVAAPHRVHADATLTRQLVENLIGNAVKYARPGATPEIRISSKAEGDGWVRVEVADSGIGVPQGEEEKIFGLFTRASSVAGDRRGSGMGLALCRQIVERHGGEISAAPNAAGGLTIAFHMPAVN